MKPKGEQDGDMSRRGFLLRAAAVGAAAFGAKKLVDIGANEKGVESEKVGEAEVTKKIGPIKEMGAVFDPVSPGVSYGGGVKQRPLPEGYKITVKFNGKEQELEVSKEEFEGYQVGQKLNVKYTQYEGTEDVLSIAK